MANIFDFKHEEFRDSSLAELEDWMNLRTFLI